MAFTIGVAELMASANMAGIATYNFFEAFCGRHHLLDHHHLHQFPAKMLEKRLNRAY